MCRGDMAAILVRQETRYENFQGIRRGMAERDVLGEDSSQERRESLPGLHDGITAMCRGRSSRYEDERKGACNCRQHVGWFRPDGRGIVQEYERFPIDGRLLCPIGQGPEKILRDGQEKKLSPGERKKSSIADITPAALREAADVLGIREKASPNEILRKFYEQIKEVHPDVSRLDPSVSHETTIRLKKAYDLLIDYCTNYPFSFIVDDLKKGLGQSPAEYWMERFGDDPIWG